MLRNIVLEARDTWKAYHKPVLCGVNLEVAEGDFVAVLGQSAAGKTTLLRILSFREHPDRGQIFFEGRLVGGSGGLAELAANKVFLAAGEGLPEAAAAAVIVLDEPGDLPGGRLAAAMRRLKSLNRTGAAVLVATREPLLAAEARVIYKLSNGRLIKITF